MSITGVHLKMVGEDGNSFAILGRAKKALRQAHKSEYWDEFKKEAMSGNHDHLLMTCMEYFEIDGDQGGLDDEFE